MSKLDKTKTIIDLLKSIIITLIVGLFGMASYGFININKLEYIQLVIIGIAIISDIIILAIVGKIIIRKINDLEEL